MFSDALIGVGVAIAIGVPLWAIIDAARRPARSFLRIGKSKTRWIAGIAALGIFFNPGGIVASIVYLTAVPPELRRGGAAALDLGPRLHELDAHHSSNDLASDADRERVTLELRDHFATGRLNLDDLNERLEKALRARTKGDLSMITRDLPSS